MMMRAILAVAFALAFGAAKAEVVRVTSGEHPDFTRVVIEYPTAVDWKVGRTSEGYELRLPDAGMQYDLSRAFDLIGKDRLAAIWSDPDSGALHFGIGCSCFAMPFELRPGTVVVDIRNGLAPKGSSFEVPLDGGAAPELSDRPQVRPVGRPDPSGPRQVYDWTTALDEAPPSPRSDGDTARPGPCPARGRPAGS